MIQLLEPFFFMFVRFIMFCLYLFLFKFANMRSTKYYFIFSWIASFFWPFQSCAKKSQEHPNLVFIMADQWRGTALGYLDVEPVITPNLDRLAAEGVAFENAVSSYPVSSPARGMLMTGQYPVSSKVTGNCNSENAPYGVELPVEARCWSDVLKDQGYSLGYIGKWHLDAPYFPYVDTYNNRGKVAWNEWCPKERRHGFDYWIAYGTYDNHLKPMYWNRDAGRDDFYYVNQWGPEYETDRAIEYLRNKDGCREEGRPFALVVSINPPHTGYELVPEKYKTLYKDLDIEKCCQRPDIPKKGNSNGDFYRNSVKDYYACMTGVDEQIGRIVETLKQEGLWENTIVVFTSDHGDCMGMHGVIGKDIYYEEAMRIQMIVTWPARIKPRRDADSRIALADLYPTLLSLMGYKSVIPLQVETFDLSERIISGNGFQPDFQPYYRIEPARSTNGWRGLRGKRYTFAIKVENGTITETVLFDRSDDPYELKNIVTENPDLELKFKKLLRKWLDRTNDSFAMFLD